MRKLPYLVAAAAIGGMALTAGPSFANPLAGGLTNGITMAAELDDGLVQKVHRWHCSRRFGWYRGHKRWHRHWRACDDYDDYGHYGGPNVSFGVFIGDDDDHDGRRFKKKRRFKKYKKY